MKTINANELHQIMEQDENWILLDVLPEESYEKAHIPGAHSAPISDPDFLSRVEEIVESPDDHIIVYCADLDCGASPKAAEKLEQQGFANVSDFEGGIDEWKKAGYKLNTEGSKASAKGR